MDISSYILEKILDNLQMGLEEDYVTENQIIKHFYFSKRKQLDQVEINSSLYLINCQYQNPVIFSRMVVNKQTMDFERAFYFKTKSTRSIEGVYNAVLTSPVFFPTNDKRINEDEALCKVVMAEKSEIYLFTQLRIDTTPPMLKNLGTDEFSVYNENPYHFYIFNSMYSNFNVNENIFLDLENFEKFKKNEYSIFHPKYHFDFIEIENLQKFDFS